MREPQQLLAHPASDSVLAAKAMSAPGAATGAAQHSHEVHPQEMPRDTMPITISTATTQTWSMPIRIRINHTHRLGGGIHSARSVVFGVLVQGTRYYRGTNSGGHTTTCTPSWASSIGRSTASSSEHRATDEIERGSYGSIMAIAKSAWPI